MQTGMEIVRAFYVAIDAGNLEKAGQFLSEDFRGFGTEPGTMSKDEALEMLSLLKAAMPNLKHALSNIRSEGSLVMLTAHAGGRHTGPLDLSNMGMGMGVGIVPGSGKMVIFLPDEFEYTVTNGKITSERNVTPVTPFNGVTGFLNALGVSR